MKIIIDNREYEYPAEPTYHEMEIGERVSGLNPAEMWAGVGVAADGSVVAITSKAALAFAAIALAHDDATLRADDIGDELRALSFGKIAFEIPSEADDDLPPAGAAGAADESRSGESSTPKRSPAATSKTRARGGRRS